MIKDNITNYGKSIRTKLLNVAQKEEVFYQTVLTRYSRNVCCTECRKRGFATISI